MSRDDFFERHGLVDRAPVRPMMPGAVVNGVRLSPLMWTMLDWLARGEHPVNPTVYSECLGKLSEAGLVLVGHSSLTLTPLGRRVQEKRGVE